MLCSFARWAVETTLTGMLELEQNLFEKCARNLLAGNLARRIWFVALKLLSLQKSAVALLDEVSRHEHCLLLVAQTRSAADPST